MLRTKFDVSILIDDQEFKIEVKEPSKKETILLQNITKEKTSFFNNDDANKKRRIEIDIEIEEAESLLEANKEMLLEIGTMGRFKILQENKILSSKIASLKKEKNSIPAIDIMEINKAFDDVMRYKYDLLVYGQQKDLLKNYIEERGITFVALWNELQNEISKAYEKK
ncbi:MAG: hypothetical protein ACK5LP_07665 [Campylobacteraceae bacterium]